MTGGPTPEAGAGGPTPGAVGGGAPSGEAPGDGASAAPSGSRSPGLPASAPAHVEDPSHRAVDAPSEAGPGSAPDGGASDRAALRAVGWWPAWVALALLFATTALVRGFAGPEGGRGPGRGPGWQGVVPWVERLLPERGWARLEHVRVADGREHLVVAWGSAAPDVACALLYALWLGLAWAWLGRRGARPRLLLDRADLGRALDALAWLVPLLTLAALAGGLVAAAVDDGAPLRRAVYGFAAPPLAEPALAPWLVLRLVVLAPLAEELAWRGVVHRGLRARWAPGRAGPAGALAFGLWHLGVGWDLPPALALQYGFALLAARLVDRAPDRLGAPIALHALGNAAALGLHALATAAPDRVLALFGVAP